MTLILVKYPILFPVNSPKDASEEGVLPDALVPAVFACKLRGNSVMLVLPKLGVEVILR